MYVTTTAIHNSLTPSLIHFYFIVYLHYSTHTHTLQRLFAFGFSVFFLREQFFFILYTIYIFYFKLYVCGSVVLLSLYYRVFNIYCCCVFQCVCVCVCVCLWKLFVTIIIIIIKLTTVKWSKVKYIPCIIIIIF